MGHPLTVACPPWSEPKRFLDRLVLDLNVGDWPIPAFHLTAPHGSTIDARRLSQGLDGALRSVLPESQRGAPRIHLDREQWMRELLNLQAGDVRPFIVVSGAESLSPGARDLLRAWVHALSEAPNPVCGLLVSGERGSIADIAPIKHDLALADYCADEARLLLQAELHRASPSAIQQLVRLCGAMPGVIHRLIESCRGSRLLPSTLDEVMHELGPISDELRAALEECQWQKALGERIDTLTQTQAAASVPDLDDRLTELGLVTNDLEHGRTRIRDPLITRLWHHGDQ